MKKTPSQIKSNIKHRDELLEATKNEFEAGLVKTGRGAHAFVYKPNDSIGVTFTSKKQNDSSLEIMQIENTKEIKIYAQRFDNNNDTTKLNEIKNSDLQLLIKNHGYVAALQASKLIAQTNQKTIVLNTQNTQIITEITEKDKNTCKFFLNRFGSIEKFDKAFTARQYLIALKSNSEKMFFLLMNSNFEERPLIYLQYKETYDQLCALDLKEDYSLILIKNKIDILLNINQ